MYVYIVYIYIDYRHTHIHVPYMHICTQGQDLPGDYVTSPRLRPEASFVPQWASGY